MDPEAEVEAYDIPEDDYVDVVPDEPSGATESVADLPISNASAAHDAIVRH
jgi:hypothetical protein